MNNTLNDQDDKLREKALKIICSAGRVTNGLLRARLHIGFKDPAEAVGTEENILYVFRKVRDEMFIKLLDFYKTKVQRV